MGGKRKMRRYEKKAYQENKTKGGSPLISINPPPKQNERKHKTPQITNQNL